MNHGTITVMHKRYGFTIVELLIVIVVIAILATITIVAFNGIRSRAEVSQASAQLNQARKKVRLYYTENNSYPATMAIAGVPDGNGSIFNISSNSSSYCVSVTNSGKSFRVVGDSTVATSGSCQGGTTNIALNATITSTLSPLYGTTIDKVTDGDTLSGNYFESQTGVASVTVDLGSQQIVGRVIVWHYYDNGRSYNNNITEISPNGSTWTTLFNSNVSGTFTENVAGHILSFTPTPVRYIRNTINGSNSNSGNHWVEIQAY